MVRKRDPEFFSWLSVAFLTYKSDGSFCRPTPNRARKFSPPYIFEIRVQPSVFTSSHLPKTLRKTSHPRPYAWCRRMEHPLPLSGHPHLTQSFTCDRLTHNWLSLSHSEATHSPDVCIFSFLFSPLSLSLSLSLSPSLKLAFHFLYNLLHHFTQGDIKYHFWLFGIIRSGIELWFPGPSLNNQGPFFDFFNLSFYNVYNHSTFWKFFFRPVLTGGLLLESEGQQVSSGFLDSSLYSNKF